MVRRGYQRPRAAASLATVRARAAVSVAVASRAAAVPRCAMALRRASRAGDRAVAVV